MSAPAMTSLEPDASDDHPAFEPHPMLRGGHLQTLAGHFLPDRTVLPAADRAEVGLPDGDRLLVFENAPAGLEDDDDERPIALLVHGLAGCAESNYQKRFTLRLIAAGVRVVRVNLRSAGAGLGIARGIYHGGRTEDVRAVVEWATRRYPEAPIGLVGFSLGGNLALKLAAEAAARPLPNFDCVVAANPPIDLSVCCNSMRRFPLTLYDRYFVRQIVAQVGRLHEAIPDLGPADLARVRSVLEFDERYTAPRNGFAGAEDYYRRASAAPSIPAIRAPGLVVHALDDPFIPADPFFATDFPSQLRLELAPTGGHLGFVSRRRPGGCRRWLDARLAHWLARRWDLTPPRGRPVPCDDGPMPPIATPRSRARRCLPPTRRIPQTSSEPPSGS